jgi:hypothetical protein
VENLVETELWPALDENKEYFSDGKIAAAHRFVQQQSFLRVKDVVLPRIGSVHSSELYERPAETLTAIGRHFDLGLKPWKRRLPLLPYPAGIQRTEKTRIA